MRAAIEREAAQAASLALEVIHPCWLIASGDSQRIEVLRSPLVRQGKSMFEPVRRFIEQHGMVLAARATFDDDDWMHGTVIVEVFVADREG